MACKDVPTGCPLHVGAFFSPFASVVPTINLILSACNGACWLWTPEVDLVPQIPRRNSRGNLRAH